MFFFHSWTVVCPGSPADASVEQEVLPSYNLQQTLITKLHMFDILCAGGDRQTDRLRRYKSPEVS